MVIFIFLLSVRVADAAFLRGEHPAVLPLKLFAFEVALIAQFRALIVSEPLMK